MITCLIVLHLAGVAVGRYEGRVDTRDECRAIAGAFRAMGFGAWPEIFKEGRR
jgi:hypothetical protein